MIFFFTSFILSLVLALANAKGCYEITAADVSSKLANCGKGLMYHPANMTSGGVAMTYYFNYDGPDTPDVARKDAQVAIDFMHVDQEEETGALIDWSTRSAACKAAFLAVACAIEFPLCKDSTCVGDACEDYHTYVGLKTALSTECTNAAEIWTKFYPDNPSVTGSFMIQMPSDQYFPDGSGPNGATKKVHGQPCGGGNECVSGKCSSATCVGRGDAEPCWSNGVCASNVCTNDVCVGGGDEPSAAATVATTTTAAVAVALVLLASLF